MEKEIVENEERNYDENPIIIKDYNPIFLALYALLFVPIIIYIYL